jgi:membrane associated rhomboid family serine protease
VRRPPPSQIANLIGPGPWTPAVRAIILTNLAVFVVTLVSPARIIGWFGLVPADVIERGRVWELATYLFVHSPTDLMHILFNMLTVWMFGVDLERRWGTRAFTRYYFITGIGAGVSMILVALLPFEATRATLDVPTIGASGSVYGLLVAWAIIFPTRQILFMLIFPLRARAYCWLMGTIAFASAVAATRSTVANVAHLGGLVVGWLYLKGPKNLELDFRYRLTKWRMARMRKKFNVHKGGNDDWGGRVH